MVVVGTAAVVTAVAVEDTTVAAEDTTVAVEDTTVAAINGVEHSFVVHESLARASCKVLCFVAHPTQRTFNVNIVAPRSVPTRLFFK